MKYSGTIKRIKLVLVFLIAIATTTITISELKSEYWNETYPTPRWPLWYSF